MPKSKHRRKPGGKAVAHPGRGKLGQHPTLPPSEDNAAPSEPGEAAPDRNDLRKLPLLAPLADDKSHSVNCAGHGSRPTRPAMQPSA